MVHALHVSAGEEFLIVRGRGAELVRPICPQLGLQGVSLGLSLRFRFLELV